ncbi:nuclear factor related to kappa-B-binding protein [Anopheles bellator]|uniref:nuclear factor related to kappa-B-binding protein n=1 Tax=Anopheles bellator TaxID=139047 RepID=UPI0026480BE6|nr:nuclear factor related to kappa-B-binding protein [Anopheles bellator]
MAKSNKDPDYEADGFGDTPSDNSYRCSSDTDESNASLLETNLMLSDKLILPKDLCDSAAVFDEFFAPFLWEMLPPSARSHLLKFLPIALGDRTSATKIVNDLLTHGMDRFGVDPIAVFRSNLAEGNYRQDIAKLRRNLCKSLNKEIRMLEVQKMARLSHNVVLCRETTFSNELQKNTNNVLSHFKPKFALRPRKRSSLQHQEKFELHKSRIIAKKRYVSEILNITETVGIPLSLSDEEDCLGALPPGPVRKNRRMFGGGTGPSSIIANDHVISMATGNVGTGKRGVVQGGVSNGSTINSFDGASFTPPKLFVVTEKHYNRLLLQHRKRKWKEPHHPEMILNGLKLKEVVLRTQLAAGYRRILPLPKVYIRQEIKNENAVDSVTDTMLYSLRGFVELKEKLKEEELKEMEMVPLKEEMDNEKPLKRQTVKSYITDSQNASLQNCESDKKIVEIQESKTIAGKPLTDLVQITTEATHQAPISSLRSRPLIAISITESVSEKTVSASPKGLLNSTHSCFLSLVRDLFCTTPDHRSSMDDLLCRFDDWFKSTAASSNTWFVPTQSKSKWHSMLHSAVQFLAGDFPSMPLDFVPYIERKVVLNVLQWIGASRDGDTRLVPLCCYWKNLVAVPLPTFLDNVPMTMASAGTLQTHISTSTTSNSALCSSSTKCKSTTVCNAKLSNTSCSSSPSSSSSSLSTLGDVVSCPTDSMNSMAAQYGIIPEDDGSISELSVSPPPPRFPTDWSVRKATEQEVQSFREQERKRYENPHLAFTYRGYSYDSVVGPVKGIYTQVPGVSKARGHNMLVADRPNYVTILTLVRDAAARLPNGEGTRADICELLKSSQYISVTATEQILQTIVSGALDRMHTEHDPCVKYDAKRKIWIYLHRNRTEKEFERLHLQYQGITKHKKSVSSLSRSASLLKKQPINILPTGTPSRETILLKNAATVTSSLPPNQPNQDKTMLSPSTSTKYSAGLVFTPHINRSSMSSSCENLEESLEISKPCLSITTKSVNDDSNIKVIEREASPLCSSSLSEHRIGEAAHIYTPQKTMIVSASSKAATMLSRGQNKFLQKELVKSSSLPVSTTSFISSEIVKKGSSGVAVAIQQLNSAPKIIGSGAQPIIPSFLSMESSEQPSSAASSNSATADGKIVNSDIELTQTIRSAMIDKCRNPIFSKSTNSVTEQSAGSSQSAGIIFQNLSVCSVPSYDKKGSQATTAGILSDLPQKISTTIHGMVRPSANVISTITLAKDQQSLLTPAQQKQIIQNLITQQQVLMAKKTITPHTTMISSPPSTESLISAPSHSYLGEVNNRNIESELPCKSPVIEDGSMSSIKYQQQMQEADPHVVQHVSSQTVKILHPPSLDPIGMIQEPQDIIDKTMSCDTSSSTLSLTSGSQGSTGVKMIKIHSPTTSSGSHAILAPIVMSNNNIGASAPLSIAMTDPTIISTNSATTSTMRILKTATGAATVVKSGVSSVIGLKQVAQSQNIITKICKDSMAPAGKVFVTTNTSSGQQLPLEALLQKDIFSAKSKDQNSITVLKMSGSNNTGQQHFVQFPSSNNVASVDGKIISTSDVSSNSNNAKKYTVLSQLNARNIIAVSPITRTTNRLSSNVMTETSNPTTVVSSLASDSETDNLKSFITSNASSINRSGVSSSSTANVIAKVPATAKLHNATKLKMFASNTSNSLSATVQPTRQLHCANIMQPQTMIGTSGAVNDILNPKLVSVRNVASAKLNTAPSLSFTKGLNIANIGGKPIIIANNASLIANQSVVVNSGAFGNTYNSGAASKMTNAISKSTIASTNPNFCISLDQNTKFNKKTNIDLINVLSTTNKNDGTETSTVGSSITAMAQPGHTQTLILGNQFVKVQAMQTAAVGGNLSNRQPETFVSRSVVDDEVYSDDDNIETTFAHQKLQNTTVVDSSTCSIVTSIPKSFIVNSNTGTTTASKSAVKIQPATHRSTGSNVKVLETSSPQINQQLQRVLLATPSGQLLTQPIVLPSGFQTTGPINIKRLKVIPVSKQSKK